MPGSMEFAAEQTFLQPPAETTDIVGVDFDLVTQDMVIAILRDEEGHLRLFEGFLREFER